VGEKALAFVEFDLVLDRETCLLYYSGQVPSILVECVDGRTVRFPVRLLRDFVNHAGVSGRFRLYYESDMRFHRLERIGPPGV